MGRSKLMQEQKIIQIILISVCILFLMQCQVQASAKNIYSDPVLSGTSGAFDGFLIDFYGEKTPKGTYWALCNWDMDASSFIKKHGYSSLGGEYSESDMGAYCGLQNTAEGRKGIMSFWELIYRDSAGKKKSLKASRIYPSGGQNFFEGEGEGTNWICSYPWKTGKWYRMAVISWKDAQKETTFVGQWVKPVSSGSWTLLSYFDTKLKNSFMKGEMSQFQENYDTSLKGIRKFRIKNIYTRDYDSGKWKSINKTVFSYDPAEWGFSTSGTHKFGATSDYFWGEAGGKVKDQQAYDRKSVNYRTYSIRQPAKPALGKPKLKSVTASKNGKVTWKLSAQSSPQLSFRITVKNKAGKKLTSVYQTRPHIQTKKLSVRLKAGYKVKIKITDIFGKSVSKTITVK